MCAAIALCAASVSAQTLPSSNVALSGRDDQLGPGLGPGVYFRPMFSPVIANDDTMGVLGTIYGPGVTSTFQYGAWVFSGGVPAIVARTGDLVAGVSGASIHGIQQILVAPGGRLAIECDLNTNQPPFPTTGVWLGTRGNLRLAALAGSQAPGVAAGSLLDSLSLHGMNDNGHVALLASITPPGNPGLWIIDGNQTTLGALANVPNPGPSGGFYPNFSLGYDFQIDNTDLLWCAAYGVIWAGSANDSVTAVGPSLGAAIGPQVSAYGFPDLVVSGSGKTVFTAMLEGGNVDAAVTDSTVWAGPPTSPSLLARSGDFAPEAGHRVLYDTLFGVVDHALLGVSDLGILVFKFPLRRGSIYAPDYLGWGLFIKNSSGISLVAQTGKAPLGMPAGFTFTGFDRPLVNDAGVVVFTGYAKNSSNVTSKGIWSYSRSSRLNLLAYVGGTLTCADGVQRTVTDVGLATDGHGGSGLSPDLVAFDAWFTDGQAGVFTSSLSALPDAIGACCTGTDCTVVAYSQCHASFAGQGVVCGLPGNPVACCPANFNGQNGVTVQDIFDYLGAWFVGSPDAVFLDNATSWNAQLYAFLNAWFAGCH